MNKLALSVLLLAAQSCAWAHDIASPDNQIKVQFELSPRGEPTYAVAASPCCWRPVSACACSRPTCRAA
jgi:hypothetical protein